MFTRQNARWTDAVITHSLQSSLFLQLLYITPPVCSPSFYSVFTPIEQLMLMGQHTHSHTERESSLPMDPRANIPTHYPLAPAISFSRIAVGRLLPHSTLSGTHDGCLFLSFGYGYDFTSHVGLGNLLFFFAFPFFFCFLGCLRSISSSGLSYLTSVLTPRFVCFFFSLLLFFSFLFLGQAIFLIFTYT